MINRRQLLECCIIPTLRALTQWEPKLDSLAARNLLLGTCLHESLGGTYLRQISGPAVSIFQIEPITHASTWEHFINYRPELRELMVSFVAPRHLIVGADGIPRGAEDAALMDPTYAAAIARLYYWRVPEDLPEHDDIPGLADYWDRHYNKNPNKGYPHQFIKAWELE